MTTSEGENPTGKVEGYTARQSLTATKTSTPIIEIPQGISVVTRDQMDDQGAATVTQALRYTPGVIPEVRGLSGYKFDLPVARGYSLDRYMDGMQLPTIGSYATPHPDAYFFERLEVLKGPASILYGQGTPAGIVNMVSKRPTEETFGETRLQFGNWKRVGLAVDFGGPVDRDRQLLYRFTAVGLDGETQVEDTKDRRIGVASALTWRPTRDTSLTILGQYQRDPELGFYNAVPAFGSALYNPRGRISNRFNPGEPGREPFDRYYASIGYELTHRFSEAVTFHSAARYMDAEFDWSTVGIVGLAADGVTASRAAGRYFQTGYGLTTDNRVEVKFDAGVIRHTALAGLDYRETDADAKLFYGAASPINIFNPVYGGLFTIPSTPLTNTTQFSKQTGLYVQDQIALGGFRLLLGGRYDWANSETTNNVNGVVTIMSDEAFTGRAGLLYLFDNGIAPYVSYSQSFQPTSGTDYFNKPFKPRTGEQYEIGVKYQPVGTQTILTVAAFDMIEQNRTTPDMVHCTPRCGAYNVQLGEVSTRGVEVELKSDVTRNFRLLAAYAYLDTKITKSNGADLGKELANAPHHTASVWGQYIIRDGTLKGLGFGGGIRYVGAAAANTASGAAHFETPAYTLVDASLQYDLGMALGRDKGLKAALNVTNLFDKDYVGGCGGTGAAAWCFYGLGRSIVGTLSYRW